MPDTEYTKGFRAGLAWEQKRIIKLIQEEIMSKMNEEWLKENYPEPKEPDND